MLNILEQRTCQGPFLKAKITTAGGLEGRLLTTMDFLREVAKIGGIRHEVSAIYKRWVSGRGCPKISGAYFYNRWWPCQSYSPTTLTIKPDHSHETGA